MKLRAVAIFMLCLLGIGLIGAMQPVRKRTAKNHKTAHDKRVYLVHADELRYNQYQNGDAQVLTGHVHFRHVGANLY